MGDASQNQGEEVKPEDLIPRKQLLAYAQMVMPLSIIGLPIAIYIPAFYSGTLGLDLAAVGLVLMVARFSDVITDPLIGRLSDRTRTRFGRRRPWIAAGLPLMMLSAYMLFVPTEPVSLGYLFLWIAAIYFGFTLIGIPYAAWGAELSGNYHERSRVTGAREMFQLLGLVLAICVPIIALSMAGDPAPDIDGSSPINSASPEAMSALGWATIVLLPISVLILIGFVTEPKVHAAQNISFTEGLRAIYRNGPFRRIILSSIVGALAGSLNVSVAILFFDHILKFAEMGLLLILVLFVAAFFGAPIWVGLGKKIGKHRALCVAAGFSLVAFSAVPLVVYVLMPNAPGFVFAAMLVITLIQGLAAGASPILGASMLADVVDLDKMRTGEHRPGFLFAFLGMVRKIFEAAGVGIALPFIAYMGFNPQADSQTELGTFAITMIYCLVPLALWIVSVAVIWNFPLTAERHARIRAAYERKSARRSKSVQPQLAD